MFLEWCWKKITNLVISARKCYLRYLHYWFYTVGVNIAHKKSSSWAIKWTLLTLKVLPLAQIHKPCFPGCNVAMLSFFFFFSPKASGIGVLLVIVLTDQQLHTTMCLCHGELEVGTHYLDSNSQPASGTAPDWFPAAVNIEHIDSRFSFLSYIVLSFCKKFAKHPILCSYLFFSFSIK